MTQDKQELNMTVAEEMASKSAIDIDVNLLKEMAESGVMYGHRKTRTQPKFKPFIFTTRNGVEIIDLAKTAQSIDKAAAFLAKLVNEKKTILLVGTQPASWDAVAKLSKTFGFPMIKNRWIGGLITNFNVIYKRIEFFRNGQKGMAAGEFEKYTKKEKGMITKKLAKMGMIFEGLDTFTKVPDAIFFVDSRVRDHETAFKEAIIAKIPIIAIIDSDDKPDNIDYPIPANDHAKSSISWVIDRLISVAKASPVENK